MSDATQPPAPPAGVSRRAALKVLGSATASVAVAGACAPEAPAAKAADSAGAAAGHAGAAHGAAAAPNGTPAARAPFFTLQERRTVDVLADYVIPRDARSGSATEAGVPAWMDAFLADPDTDEKFPAQIRGGLAWLNGETFRRFGHGFAAATDPERRQVLDDIAYPARARPEMRPGVAFFTRFRDFTASGFFSSRAGYEDLRYMGNVARPVWDGCPDEANARLGVSQAVMDTRVPVQERTKRA